MLIGFAKLLTICLTVLSGFRGGFIFPLFFAGTAFGKGFALLPIAAFAHFPPVLFAMTIAAGAALSLIPLPACSILPSSHVKSHLICRMTLSSREDAQLVSVASIHPCMI